MASHVDILARRVNELERLVADIEANATDPDPQRPVPDRLVAIRTALATSGVDFGAIRDLRNKATRRPSPEAADALLESEEFDDLGVTDCPEGCRVEPDGHCPHGYESAGLTSGMV